MVVGVGAGIVYSGVLKHVIITTWVVSLKARGTAPDCPWRNVVTYYSDLEGFSSRVELHTNQLQVEQYDQAFDIQLISHPSRNYLDPQERQLSGSQFARISHHGARLAGLSKCKQVLPARRHCARLRGARWNIRKPSVVAGRGTRHRNRPGPDASRMPPAKLRNTDWRGPSHCRAKAVWSTEGMMTLNIGWQQLGRGSRRRDARSSGRPDRPAGSGTRPS